MSGSDKLVELRNLKQKLKLPTRNKNSFETEGLIIQILKQITYFRSEAEIYGIEVLAHYIPIIEPYMLRASMQIIGTRDEYVVVEGLVKGTKSNGELGNVYPEGVLIDPSLEENKPQQERESLSSTVQNDTKLIKICRNSQDPRLAKHSQNLSKFQKQRQAKQRQMQRMLGLDKNVQACKQKIKKFQFFQHLTSYDLNELVLNSKLIYFKKGSTLHQFGQEVNRVGFLTNGQVKVDNSVIHNKQKPLEPGRLLLDKYMIHKKQHNSSVVSNIEPGEWIGLEEYLWSESSFLSKAQVVSHDAEVLYVPVQIFEKKFNELTNFYLINKLKGLIETKKKLLDKSIQTKKQKQNQIFEQKIKMQALQRLHAKLDKKRETSHEGFIQNSSNSRQQNSIKKRKRHHHFPSQCYMPDRLVHKVKVFEQKYESLPKIQQRFTLFPQEYEKAMVPLQLRQELKNAKKARQPITKSDVKPFKILSNEEIYPTVIYASLSPKQVNPEQENKKFFSKLKSNASGDYSIDLEKKIQMLETIGSVTNTTRQRFNASIFNNFRAPKNKGQKLLQNISKTLQII